MNNNNQQYSIETINEISLDVIEFYRNNLDLAKKQYDELMNKSKSRGLDKKVLTGYYEIHHIVARCLNGTNDRENLVLLTYKEHVLAHMLLYVLNPENKDLFLAFSLLVQVNHGDTSTPFSINLDYLDELKTKRSKLMSGENNPMKNPETAKKMSEHRKGIGSFTGKHHTKKTKSRLSEITKSFGWVGEKHPMYGRHHSPESIEKIRRNQKHQPIRDKDSWRKKLSESSKQKVVGPDGTIYESVKKAAEDNGVHRSTMSKYIHKNPEKGFKFL